MLAELMRSTKEGKGLASPIPMVMCHKIQGTSSTELQKTMWVKYLPDEAIDQDFTVAFILYSLYLQLIFSK